MIADGSPSPAFSRKSVSIRSAAAVPTDDHPRDDPFYVYLESLSLKKYYKSLHTIGVTQVEQLQDVTEEDITTMEVTRFDRRSFLSMISGQKNSNGSKPHKSVASNSRPHHGGIDESAHSNESGRLLRNRSKSKSMDIEHNILGDRHAMISYDWECQSEVISIRTALKKRGVKCWMDIDGQL